MFAKLKKKVLEEEEAAGGPERLGFSPRKLPGGAVAVRSPPAVAEEPTLPAAGDGGTENEEVEREKKEKEAEPQPLQSVNMVK